MLHRWPLLNCKYILHKSKIISESNSKRNQTRNVSEIYMPPLVENSKLLFLCTRHGCNPSIKFGIDQLKVFFERFWADNTLGSKEWFDFNLWTCDLKINRDHLLIGGKPCTKFGIDQVKGSKDIERTTHWAEKSGLTLTFDHVTWKSIGIIYSLRATPARSLVLIKWMGQKILSGQHTGLRRVGEKSGLTLTFEHWPENQ